MAVPQDRRTVPIALLPIDLIAELRMSSKIDVRRAKDSKPGGAFSWTASLAAGLLALGALEVLTISDAAPFSYSLRWFSLLAGASMLGAYLMWKRQARYRPPRGDGIFVGPTSVVIVREHSVDVIPAEDVVVNSVGVVYQGNTIDDGFHDKGWIAELEAAIRRGREDAAAREADRYRQAAAKSSDAIVRDDKRARRMPVLVGAAAGLTAALFLEAGPIGAAGAHARETTQAKWRDAENANDDLGAAIMPRGEKAVEIAKARAAETARRNKERHDHDLSSALDGSL